jgi:hypothetical protein
VADETLRDLPAHRIIGHIADAAARWRNADFPPRVRATAAIEERLGYSTPVIEYALDRLFFGITAQGLETAIAAELGAVAALDGPLPRAHAPAAWARGVEWAVVISSDTTVGVALVPALFALCAKARIVVKDRSDALVAGFFATLAEEHPAFSSAAIALPWEGGSDPVEDELFATADVVVGFGRDDALTAIRARCGAETRFVPFGHRASIGRLSARGVQELDAMRADVLVRDALLYDGEGCLSLHATFVTGRTGALAQVASLLAAAGERAALEFPIGRRTPERIAAIAGYRNLARYHAATRGGAMIESGTAVVVEGSLDAPPPFLPGALVVIPISGDDDVAAYVAAHRLPVQALGVDVVDPASIELAARIGAVRVCLFGTMQDPPLAGHHGGEPRIAPFVRWLDTQ